MSDNTTTESDNTISSSITPDEAVMLSKLFTVLTSMSLTAATIGVLTFLYIRSKYPKLADRVTFRLAFAGLISEVLFAVFQITLNIQLSPTPLCGFLTWGW